MVFRSARMNSYVREYQNENFVTEVIGDAEDLKKYAIDKDFTILQMNIRSILMNFAEFTLFLEHSTHKFDILILTETFQIDELELFHLSGYNCIYNEGKYNRNDGIVVYVREDIKHSSRIVMIGEIAAIETDVGEKDQKVKITSIYKSPQIKIEIFNEEISNYLHKTEKCNKHIIAGDININLLSDEIVVEEYLNNMYTYGFESIINRCTRPKTGSCIDHIFVKGVNTQHNKLNGLVLEYLITDHFPVIMCADLKISKKSEKMCKRKCKQYTNYEGLREGLLNEEWKEIYGEGDVHYKTEKFINILKKYIEDNTKTIQFNNKKVGRKKWMTPALLKLINKKNSLYMRLRRTPLDESLQQEYVSVRNRLKYEIIGAKKKYLQEYIHNEQSDSKALWAQVKDLCNDRKPEPDVQFAELLDDEISDSTDVAEKFNNYYTSLGRSYAEKIQSPKKIPPEIPFLSHSFFISPTDPTEVEKIIAELKSKKAVGFDGLRAETLKRIRREIAQPLSHLVNLYISEGIFPDILKIGIIRPIYKNGDKSRINNYRPITLLSTLAKVVERILKVRMVKFLGKYEILSKNQFGFREGKSTEDALKALIGKIYNCMDEQQPCLGIFIDLSKAFDTVSHDKLLDKLYAYGFRGVAYNLMKSYLSNRKQIVEINGHRSGERVVTYGVPQGTVLGPLLFLIYVNSLFELRTRGEMVGFADDVAVFHQGETWENLKHISEVDFSEIMQWLQYNLLTLNVEKTRYLPFTSYTPGLPNFKELNISSTVSIPETASIKYLGIVIDRHLKWDEHVKYINRKLRGLLYRFKYVTRYVEDRKNLHILYDGLVSSQISYGILGWGGLYDNQLKKVNILQKRILKIMYQKEITYPSHLIYELSKVLDARQIYTLKIVCDIYKKKLPMDTLQHHYNTRGENRYGRPRSKKKIGQRYYAHIAPRLMDLIPGELMLIKNYVKFKKSAKQWILNTDKKTIHGIINLSSM